MRHGKGGRRLSRVQEQRQALLDNTARNLLIHGRIRTTVVKAKETRRLADRLITYGKEGSVHARRLAYRVLQDRTLVRRLFADIAPLFQDCQGGYTRILRLTTRPGDGAELALLELTRFPAAEAPKTKPQAKASKAAAPEPATAKATSAAEEGQEKPKGFFEGLRKLFGPKTKTQ